MLQIKEGLFDCVDVEIYANPAFNSLQMEQIRIGLKDDLRVEVYAKPDIPEGQMREMRLKLMRGDVNE